MTTPTRPGQHGTLYLYEIHYRIMQGAMGIPAPPEPEPKPEAPRRPAKTKPTHK